jgi:hypothetical protein
LVAWQLNNAADVAPVGTEVAAVQEYPRSVIEDPAARLNPEQLAYLETAFPPVDSGHPYSAIVPVGTVVAPGSGVSICPITDSSVYPAGIGESTSAS